jgi:hypothetical protein
LAFVFFALGSFVSDGSSRLLTRGGSNIGVVMLSGVIMDGTKVLKQIKKFEEDDEHPRVVRDEQSRIQRRAG